MLLFLEHIPPIILAACALLVALFFAFVVRMLAEARRVLRDVADLSGVLRRLLPSGLENRREGLRLADIEKIRGALQERRDHPVSPNVFRLWADIEASLQPYSADGRPEGWFAVRPVGEILPEAAVVDRGYYAAFHQSVPSVLTSLGLMATFIAILFALEGVNVQVKGGAEIVEGIGALINGLAGKFLSSIVALFLAVSFSIIEKKLCERRLENAYDALLRQAGEVIPVLSAARVLLDMQALSARRTTMIENFYKEIAERLASLVGTEIVPGLAGHFAREVAGQVEEFLAPAIEEMRQSAARPAPVSLPAVAQSAASVPGVEAGAEPLSDGIA
jgi:hypothetical protein